MPRQAIHRLGLRGVGEFTHQYEQSIPALVFVCQTCGEAHTRMIPEGYDGWRPLSALCPEHGGTLCDLGFAYREFEIPAEFLVSEIEGNLRKLERGATLHYA